MAEMLTEDRRFVTLPPRVRRFVNLHGIASLFCLFCFVRHVLVLITGKAVFANLSLAECDATLLQSSSVQLQQL